MWTNHAGVQVYTAHLTGPDAPQREQELFDLINFGGVAQGQSDLD